MTEIVGYELDIKTDKSKKALDELDGSLDKTTNGVEKLSSAESASDIKRNAHIANINKTTNALNKQLITRKKLYGAAKKSHEDKVKRDALSAIASSSLAAKDPLFFKFANGVKSNREMFGGGLGKSGGSGGLLNTRKRGIGEQLSNMFKPNGGRGIHQGIVKVKGPMGTAMRLGTSTAKMIPLLAGLLGVLMLIQKIITNKFSAIGALMEVLGTVFLLYLKPFSDMLIPLLLPLIIWMLKNYPAWTEYFASVSETMGRVLEVLPGGFAGLLVGLALLPILIVALWLVGLWKAVDRIDSNLIKALLWVISPLMQIMIALQYVRDNIGSWFRMIVSGLSSLGTWIVNGIAGLFKGIGGLGMPGFGDVIVTPGGQMIKTDPADTLIAMKSGGDIESGLSGEGNGGRNVVLNVYAQVIDDSTIRDIMEKMKQQEALWG